MGIYEIKKPKKINSFSVTIFFVVVAVGYTLYWYIPEWWPVFQMTGIMSGIGNDAYREHDDEKLMTKLLKESKRTQLPLTRDNFSITRTKYTETELGKMKLDSTEIVQRRGKNIVIAFHYEKNSQLPFLNKTVHLSWNKSVPIDLSIVQY